MKKIPILLLISLLFLCMKCEDYLEPGGIEATVYGRVYDSVNDIPIADFKIKVIESNTTGFYNTEEFIQVLDSTYTDVDGFYELTFITSGKGDHYTLAPERDKDNVWTYYQDAVEVEPSNSNLEVDFNFLHLYPAMVNIRVDSDVEYLPVGFIHRYDKGVIYIEETDTVIRRRIYIDKNTSPNIEFYQRISLNEWKYANFDIPATETTEEIEFDIHVTNADFKDSD